MNEKIHTKVVDQLFDAVLTLENREECYRFFEDLCTTNELMSLSQRFAVAAMLKEKKTYIEIAGETGASTATISRVNRSLSYGNDSYDMVLQRMKQENQNKDSDVCDTTT
ncbi:MAG: TrpR YerC/YecD [Lachnospiraceae bacterium]|nr:TrpR YerC/YecD [Lachnospiraceae bacterium]